MFPFLTFLTFGGGTEKAEAVYISYKFVIDRRICSHDRYTCGRSLLNFNTKLCGKNPKKELMYNSIIYEEKRTFGELYTYIFFSLTRIFIVIDSDRTWVFSTCVYIGGLVLLQYVSFCEIRSYVGWDRAGRRHGIQSQMAKTYACITDAKDRILVD